jgi:hypothetical protein
VSGCRSPYRIRPAASCRRAGTAHARTRPRRANAVCACRMMWQCPFQVVLKRGPVVREMSASNMPFIARHPSLRMTSGWLLISCGRRMDIYILHQSGVHLGPAQRVGLVRHAQVDPFDLSQSTVELGRSRCTGPDADGKALSFRFRLAHPSDQCGRNRLRIAGTGEPAHPHIRPCRDECGGLLGRHDLVGECPAPKI